MGMELGVREGGNGAVWRWVGAGGPVGGDRYEVGQAVNMLPRSAPTPAHTHTHTRDYVIC